MELQVNASPSTDPKRVYYTGTDQLEVGYALCYDHTATLPEATTPIYDKSARGRAVVKPATANLNAFAGVVAVRPQTIGPCYVDIYRPTPREWARMYTNANMTVLTSALTPQNGSYALAAFADATLNIPFCAIAGETVDTSGTAAVKWCIWR